MSDLQLLLYTGGTVLAGDLVVIILTLVRMHRGQVPEEIRARYPKRIIDRSQMPFAEKWRESVDQSDIPVLVRARTRKFECLMATAIFAYLVLIFRLMQLHIVIRMLLA
jgi:hypothetical protein